MRFDRKFAHILMGVLVASTFAVSTAACGSTPQAAPAGSGQTAAPKAAPAQAVTIKFSHVSAPASEDPYQIGSTIFKELVEERSNGRIQVQIFPSQQLGNERDVIEGIGLGTVDAGLITNAPIGGFANANQVFDLPFILKDEQTAHQVLDGPIGQGVLDKLEPLGIKGLAWAEGGFRHMINNIRPVNKPEDVVGVKYRVMENPVYMGMFRSLGSNPTPMAWGETFTAVQQRTIDGLEIPIPVIHQNKFYEVAKYLSLTGHTYSPLVYMISKRTWDRLSAEDQAMMVQAAKEAGVRQRAENAKNINALVDDLKAKGMEVNEVADKAQFQQKVQPVYDEFRPVVGPDLLDSVMKAGQ
jgi:TRAP-type transport system periplasmic protein